MINFNLPLLSVFEADSEFTKYLRETEYPICYLSNKLNQITNKLNIFLFDQINTNSCRWVKNQDQTICNLS